MIIRLLRGLGQTALGVVALAASAAAQGAPNQPASNPACVRLESQLAAINAGSTDPTRADQVKRAEDAVAKQQADLDRTLAQAHKQGCEGQGFLSLFSSLVPQCGPINSKIQQMRGDLDRATTDLEQLKSGTGSQDSQRRALIGQLAQNNCGAQYTTAANEAGPTGFFDRLFGGGAGGPGGGTILNPGGDGAPAGTFHTVCVRTCDGYYFPISYSTVPSRFPDDERACQRLCPAAEVALYSFHNPGEAMEQAVSASGQLYTALPNAFHYRKEFTPACSCRKPGQSWGEALKDADDSTTLQGGDIVVTDQTAKTLSQAPQPKPVKGAPAQAAAQPATAPAMTPAPTPASAQPASNTDPAKKTVRTVGPPFVSR
jgi:Protein of unknown function (DUF2865)